MGPVGGTWVDLVKVLAVLGLLSLTGNFEKATGDGRLDGWRIHDGPRRFGRRNSGETLELGHSPGEMGAHTWSKYGKAGHSLRAEYLEYLAFVG